MSTEEQLKFSRRYARFSTQPQGFFAKFVAFVLGALFLVLAFTFSLIALAAVAVGGLLFWGWLRWKTRELRHRMEEMASMSPSPDDGGRIIEGEAIREGEARRCDSHLR